MLISSTNLYQERNYNLDFLKAISMLFIIIWHLQPIKFAIVSKSILSNILSFMLGIFYSQVSLIAVPIFYIISIYLFFLKTENDSSYFKKRLLRICTIFVFWTGVQFLLFYSIAFIFYDSIPKFNWIITLMKGGPDLPIIYGSVFYFLFDLIVLICLAHIYKHLTFYKINYCLSWLLIIFFLIYFEYQNLYGYGILYWRIDNFIVYVPVAFLLFKNPNSLKKYTVLFFLFYLIFSALDIFKVMKWAVFPYSRISIFFGAITVFCFIGTRSIRSKKKYIQFISNFSLGIYALHKYCQFFLIFLFALIFKIIGLPGILLFGGIQINSFWFITSLFSILFTFIIVYLLGLTPFKKLLS